MAVPLVIFVKQLKLLPKIFTRSQRHHSLFRGHLRFRVENNYLYLGFRMSNFNDEEHFSTGGVNNLLDSKSYPPDDIFETPRLMRRQSTLQDEQRMIFLLKDILDDQNKNVSSWIVENNVKILCTNYKGLLDVHKEGFLKVLATKYSVDHERICKALHQYKDFEPGSTVLLKAEEQLKSVLTPQYSWLFKVIGRLENGVKFLVDLRTDILVLIHSLPSSDPAFVPLQHLNNTLKDLLSLWFSVGFLNLERITWKSSCEMLQKVSEYEAVHPVRSWADLKRRVGLYRRCYVYTHNSMPSEPIVVLHTALTNEVSSSIRAIVTATQRMSSVDSTDENSGMFGTVQRGVEDPSAIKAAIFYSITSTQKGLHGIELGNYLIKTVVREIQAELPQVQIFSSLSPIPLFRTWLIDKIKSVENGEVEPGIDMELWKPLLDKYNSFSDIKKAILSNLWHSDRDACLFEEPLMRACSYYLYMEKVRSSAYDPVANFHLRNGAVMWRLNWLADTSPRGMTNSCGMMVNYRYFLEDLEDNSRRYLEENIINASEQVLKLVGISPKM